MRLPRLAWAVGACAAIAGCSSTDDPSSNDPAPGAPSTTPNGAPGQQPPSVTTPGAPKPGSPEALARHKAEMLTSIWENSTTVLQYRFSRNNGDGYGYTSGRAGFTTGTNDSLMVVQCYDADFGTGPANLMHKYVPALTALSKKTMKTGQVQGDTSGLDAVGDYNADWSTSATDPATAPAFDGCQDEIVEQLYFEPSIAIAKKWGLSSALAMAALYDADIVHGEDNVNELAKQANDDTGNGAQAPASAPLSRDAESAWLGAFLAHRVELLNGSDAWRNGIDRAANYEKLRRAGNFDMTQEIVTDARTKDLFPGGDYAATTYPVCVIAPNGDVSGDPMCTAPVAD